MHRAIELLLTRTWWKYDPKVDRFSIAYHYMNLAEGCVWLVLGALVLVRYLRQRNSAIELLYALAFGLFGASDFREAYALESWLILAKGANLAALLWLRHIVIHRYYPASRLY
jgi:hypothetical protein